MQILVFNGGSSSLTFKILRHQGRQDPAVVLKGKAYRVGVEGAEGASIEFDFQGARYLRKVPIPDHVTAAKLAIEFIRKKNISVNCIGNRFVHGGTYFQKSAWINSAHLRQLEKCLPFAPIHNPISLSVIRTARRLLKKVPQYVVFDSAFHASLPDYVYSYPIPLKWRKKYQYRKYGFHGLSYSYVTWKTAALLDKDRKKLNMIACHLGTGGSSVTAVQNGRSLETSMGFSPLCGLMMSTRCGDLDPFLILYLLRHSAQSPETLIKILNKKSGLLGVSGYSADIRDIIKRIKNKKANARVKLALDMYIKQLKRYIGSYVTLFPGPIDALVFTDDVGIKVPEIRQTVCRSLNWAGIDLSVLKNRKAPQDHHAFIEKERNAVKIITMPTDEESVLFEEGARLIGRKGP
jgi:acetate kinase